MSIIQVAAATQAVTDAEKALVEAFKPLLQSAARNALPRLRAAHAERAGEYARRLQYFITIDLRQCFLYYGYSPAVEGMLDAALVDIFYDIHSEEFING